MKLWKLMFRHYSLKDSEEGILCYLLANSSEQIYMYLRDNTNIEDGSEYGIRICTMWKYKEDPNEPDYDPKYKDRIIACCGEMFDEMEQVDDRYYGVTHYGWKCVCKRVNLEQIKLLRELGVSIVNITKEDETDLKDNYMKENYGLMMSENQSLELLEKIQTIIEEEQNGEFLVLFDRMRNRFKYLAQNAKPIKVKYHKGVHGYKYDYWTCGNCGCRITYDVGQNFCWNCGHALKWDSPRCLTK